MKFITRSAGAIALASIAAPALAHHPLGGGTPVTFAHGLLSGIGHPMLGMDHFAFIAAMAIAALAMGRLFSAPLAFMGASLVGVMLVWAGVALPFVEPIVALSAFAVGLLVLSGRKLSLAPALGLFAVAGIFHGAAYGGAIIGAEATPVLAYLIGLFATQYLIAIATGLIAQRVWNISDAAAVPARIAGGITAGIGFVFLFEIAETMVFGPLA